jgi:outer membrane protein OmpA-like peptidoglycan-associated protein
VHARNLHNEPSNVHGFSGRTNYQLGGIAVKPNIRKWKLNVLFCASSAILLAGLAYGATSKTRQLAVGDTAKVTGSIVSRNGDLVRVVDKKSGDVVVVSIDDKTQIERKKHGFPFFRHADMDVTAMVPGLTIEAEGVGNSKGQLEAAKISFAPDEFAIEVAQEKQVLANKAAAQNAQSTADQGGAAASLAQSSAAQAKNSADQASLDAQAAGDLGIADAAAVAMVNQRVSDLDDYKNEFEVDVFFARDSAVLDKTAKRDLANLADIAKSLDGYMIEIAGYASNTLSKETDQKVSEERAAAVARYFREVKDIPMRRILVPVGYGTTHPVASNRDPHARELNRRVDVKVLVNKSLGQGL